MSKKKIIGYTTGVFDLFHIGHLNILKRAKENCDHLIVGVTTDELAHERKKRKPLIPFHERVEIVNAVQYVDAVVVQEVTDKMKAWQEHNFDVMFVGDDWKGTNFWNKLEEDFKALGVKIVYIPYTKDTSSTILSNKIAESDIL